MSFFARRRAQRACFHHNHHTGESWIRSVLVDLGRNKRFWCTKCEKSWFV